MSVKNKSTKEEKLLAVSVAVLEVIEKDGVLGVTHSKVSRKSGVSRAWIYEYIGQDKNAFIKFAAESVAGYFSRIQMTLPADKEQLKSQLGDGIQFLFDSAIKDPVIVKIYFRFRGTGNAIGKVIEKYESQWTKIATKSAAKILNVPDGQAALIAETALTLRLGFAHKIASSESPKEARAQAEKIFDHLHSYLSMIG